MPATGYDEMPGMVAIPGVGIGTVTHRELGTGVTVILLPEGAVGGVDIGGGAPATRETPLLDPKNVVAGPDAIVLCGGSALGLQAADGVALALWQQNRGLAVGNIRIPIVVAAAIFDLDFGQAVPPTPNDGRAALKAAEEMYQHLPEGSYGAGTGATVGKSLGKDYAMKGGQGAVTLRTPDGLHVSAVVVVNAVGSIVSETGTIVAGPRLPDGTPVDTTALWSAAPTPLFPGGATTIGAVITDARLSKAELARICRMAHDGLARAIDPAHTPWDGDTIFATSVGSVQASAARVGALAARAFAIAARRAVSLAGSEPSRPLA
ncbi:MAG: P1 family peptidase [Thermaerobacter sp.]|nr:P1 family peptidase [Thermaerobacter sp.]